MADNENEESEMNDSAFMQLVADTRSAFRKSDIRKMAEQNGYEWNYSISYRIMPHRPLILGFNWGAEEGVAYEPKDEFPQDTFMETYEQNPKNLGSMIRIVGFLKKYLPESEWEEIGCSNFCFFRSDKDPQISDDDLKLCEPLFSRFLSLAQPSAILAFSSRLLEHVVEQGWLTNPSSKDIPFESGGITVTYTAVRGTFAFAGSAIPFLSLPHPNYPITGKARESAWQFCFNDELAQK